MLDTLIYVVFPYTAVAVAVIGTLYRYFTNQFSFTSMSSQFLESDLQFWGSTLWHYGIIPTLAIHLAGFAIPGVMNALHSTPETLYIAELMGKVLGIMALVGGLIMIFRRATLSRIRAITTKMDWAVLILLTLQVFFGLWIAFGYRWGAVWFLHTATPWIVSLTTFDPAPQFVAALPWVLKIHFLNGFLLLALFPFSRLVHMTSFPVHYLWRRFQIVIWNRQKAP